MLIQWVSVWILFLHWQRKADQGITHNTHLRPHSLHVIVSLIIFMILLAVFNFTLLFTHGIDVIIPGNPIFFSPIFVHKILWELMVLGFLIGKFKFLERPWDLLWFNADSIGDNKRLMGSYKKATHGTLTTYPNLV